MNWQRNRIDVHNEGKHVVPQWDCGPCWDEGNFKRIIEPADREGLWHTGQHFNCRTCDEYVAGLDEIRLPSDYSGESP